MNAFLMHWMESGGYVAIALLMALENIIPPIPSELIMGIGGIWVARGRMDVLPLILAGTLGATAGNYVLFWIGRRYGIERLYGFVVRHGRWLTLDWRSIERINRVFLRHGSWIVFVFRFMPLGRSVVSLPAGLFGMSSLRFIVWTAAGAAIWNSLLVWAGWALGTKFREIDHYIAPVTIAICVVAVVGYTYRLITWRPRA